MICHGCSISVNLNNQSDRTNCLTLVDIWTLHSAFWIIKSLLERTYFHQIEGVEFSYDRHGRTFLSTLYIRTVFLANTVSVYYGWFYWVYYTIYRVSRFNSFSLSKKYLPRSERWLQICLDEDLKIWSTFLMTRITYFLYIYIKYQK